LGPQPVLQLGDGEVGRRRQQRVDQLGVVDELGAPAAAHRLGSRLPVWRQRRTSLTTQLGLTSNSAAVARRNAPASTPQI